MNEYNANMLRTKVERSKRGKNNLHVKTAIGRTLLYCIELHNIGYNWLCNTTG